MVHKTAVIVGWQVGPAPILSNPGGGTMIRPLRKAKSRSLTPAWNAAGIGMTTLFAMRDEILRKIRILMN
jgi:hypothetical protein